MDVKWIEFFTKLGITSAWAVLLVFILSYVAKRLFEFFVSGTADLKKVELGKDLENFKQVLASQAQIHKLELDKTLEGYKNSLQQVSLEHQIRFSKLHADRAETIKLLFSKLVKMEDSMTSFMAPFQAINDLPPNEKAKIAADDGTEFLEFYHTNELLFGEETCRIIHELNESFRSAFIKHNIHLRREKNSNLYNEPSRETVDPYFDILKKEVPKLKKLLTDDFRKTLGVI